MKLEFSRKNEPSTKKTISLELIVSMEFWKSIIVYSSIHDSINGHIPGSKVTKVDSWGKLIYMKLFLML